jgi:hypothetical protein
MKTLRSIWARLVVLFLFALGGSINSQAQHKLIRGVITAAHNGEIIAYASLQFKGSGKGKISDSSGTFSFHLFNLQADTLKISAIGYQDQLIYLNPGSYGSDTIVLQIRLTPGKLTSEIIIRSKVNRGLILWKRIVAHKALNDRQRYDNFSYELYNKLEFDLKNINREKAMKMGLLKPFNFIFDNIDTSEGYPYLPAYLMESLSDYYYQSKPNKRREVIKGSKTIGLQNESFSKLLGGMDQNINVYKNFIPVFNQSYVSPISDHGDEYYRYKIADTQRVNGR